MTRLTPIVKLGVRLLSDEKFPDPVVPPDLHLVKAVHADADGKVPCIWCGTRVPIATADMIGSDGYACASCTARGALAPLAPPPTDVSIRGTNVLLLLAVGALIAIVIVVAVAA